MIPSVVNYRPHLRQPRKSRPSSASLPLFSSTSSASFSFISHLPYLLPSSVSCNSFVCHSYANSASRTVLRDENCRGVYQQFPNRNVPALAGMEHSSSRNERSGSCRTRILSLMPERKVL